MRGDNFADLLAAGDVGMHHFADVAVELGRRSLGFGLELGAEVSAFFAVDLNDGFPERELHALVAFQPCGDVIAVVAETVGQAGRIERGLRGASAGMGAGNKRGVARERAAARWWTKRR